MPLNLEVKMIVNDKKTTSILEYNYLYIINSFTNAK